MVFACQEVSGLETDPDVETVSEGGDNRFVHQLPKPVKQANLKLKRGLTTSDAKIVAWCKSTLENDFAAPIKPRDITLSLLDGEGDPVARWQVSNAYPVKWTVGGFDAMKNELVIEMIELAHAHVRRVL